MNIYDTKVVKCDSCDKPIGEVEFDSSIHLFCTECTTHLSKEYKILYFERCYQTTPPIRTAHAS